MIASNGPSGLRIKVELNEIKPSIWRRFCVPSDITLGELHHLLLIVMGWEGSHLHLFRFKGQEIGPLDEPDVSEGMLDEEDVFLDELFTEIGTSLTYIYDFGDEWVHTLTHEGPLQSGDEPLTALDGERACPPEDCGGPFGYLNLLQAQNDPQHPEHQEMMEWLGDPIDPEEFDLDDINEALASWEQTQQFLLDQMEELDGEDFETMLEMEYNPYEPVDPDLWLELDESERMSAIQLFHEIEEVDLPNATLHAVIHCVVENQLAEGLAETQDALQRLITQGLDRHEAIHAMGSVLAEHLFDTLSGTRNGTVDPNKLNQPYLQALKQLNARDWLARFKPNEEEKK